MEQTFKMVCSDLGKFNLKKELPFGFSFRNYRIGESKVWAEIVTSAGEFTEVSDALKRFNSEFLNFEKEFSKRTIFLIDNKKNYPIGTATAWYDESNNAYGRLHWVSIRKDYQGRGLARPLTYETLNILKKYHQSAYLTTQDSSWKAIRIYEDCGFIKK